MKLVIDHILKLQNYIQSLEALQIDSEEFAYLKALVLFSPGKWIYNRPVYSSSLWTYFIKRLIIDNDTFTFIYKYW